MMFNTFTERKESLRNTVTADVNNDRFVRAVRNLGLISSDYAPTPDNIISDALRIWAYADRFDRKMAIVAKAVHHKISIEFFKAISLRSKSDQRPGIQWKEDRSL